MEVTGAIQKDELIMNVLYEALQLDNLFFK